MGRATPFLRSGAVWVAPFVGLLAIVLLNLALGRNYPLLSDHADFGGYFRPGAALLDAALVAVVMAYCHALGKRLARLAGVCLPSSVAAALGLAALNVFLIPLALFNLLYVPVLLALFFVIGLLARREIRDVWERMTRLRAGDGKALAAAAVFMVFFVGHALNAGTPVNFGESLGDVAYTYQYIPMTFAYFHGIRFVPVFASSLGEPANHPVLGSAFIVLSNPGIVKPVGGALFLLMCWMFYDFVKDALRVRYPLLFALLLLLTPVFLCDTQFSFAHPRIYLVFLAFLSFHLLFLGIQQSQPGYHYLLFVVMGILAGTTWLGSWAVITNGLILLLFSSLWKRHLGKYLLFSIGFLLLASVYPVWNYFHIGSPAPQIIPVSHWLHFQANPDFCSERFRDRLSLQFALDGRSVWDFVWFPLRFILGFYGWLVVFFGAGLCFTRHKGVRILYFYCLSNVALCAFFFPNSVHGGAMARFIWYIAPVVLALIACVMTRFAGAAARLKWLGEGRAVRLVFVGALLASMGWCWAQLSRSGALALLGWKLAFVRRTINLGDFLGGEAVAKTVYLNDRFSGESKILYLFYSQGIYAKPELWRPLMIHPSPDPAKIMSKLKEVGIGYLIVDNKFGFSPDDPGVSMVADLATPLFEPDFFARHFIPIPDGGIEEFYVFRINYAGLGQEQADRNFRRIDETGFFLMVKSAVGFPIPEARRGHLRPFRALSGSPYSPDVLRDKYAASYPRLPSQAGPRGHPLVTVDARLIGTVGVAQLQTPVGRWIEHSETESWLWLGGGEREVLGGVLWSEQRRRIQVLLDVSPEPARKHPELTVELTVWNEAEAQTLRRRFDRAAVLALGLELEPKDNEFRVAVLETAPIGQRLWGKPRPTLVMLRHMTIR